MSEKPVGIYVDEEIKNKIKQIAASRGLSIRAITEELLRKEIQRAEGEPGDGRGIVGSDGKNPGSRS